MTQASKNPEALTQKETVLKAIEASRRLEAILISFTFIIAFHQWDSYPTSSFGIYVCGFFTAIEFLKFLSIRKIHSVVKSEFGDNIAKRFLSNPIDIYRTLHLCFVISRRWEQHDKFLTSPLWGASWGFATNNVFVGLGAMVLYLLIGNANNKSCVLCIDYIKTSLKNYQDKMEKLKGVSNEKVD